MEIGMKQHAKQQQHVTKSKGDVKGKSGKKVNQPGLQGDEKIGGRGERDRAGQAA
jgi:hypothetical protein